MMDFNASKCKVLNIILLLLKLYLKRVKTWLAKANLTQGPLSNNYIK